MLQKKKNLKNFLNTYFKVTDSLLTLEAPPPKLYRIKDYTRFPPGRLREASGARATTLVLCWNTNQKLLVNQKRHVVFFPWQQVCVCVCTRVAVKKSVTMQP